MKLFEKIKKHLKRFKKWVNNPPSKPVKSRRIKIKKKAPLRASKRKTAASSRPAKRKLKKEKTKPVKKAGRGKKTSVQLPKTPKTADTLPKNAVYVGTIDHYFPKVKAAAFTVESATLALKEKILILGKNSRFQQTLTSLQINRIPIDVAKKGEGVGIQTKKDVSPGDKIYRLSNSR